MTKPQRKIKAKKTTTNKLRHCICVLFNVSDQFQSSSASQEVPVKLKLQPAPELFLTQHKSQSRPDATYRYIKMLSLHMIAAWENK